MQPSRKHNFFVRIESPEFYRYIGITGPLFFYFPPPPAISITQSMNHLQQDGLNPGNTLRFPRVS